MTREISLEYLPKPWTRRQYLFAMGILGGLNGVQAALEAGFSKNGTGVHSHRMLHSPNFKHIQAFINDRQQRAVEKHSFNHEEHIASIVKQASLNLFDYYRPDPNTGELKIDWRLVPYELGKFIDSVTTKQLSIKTVEGGEEISLPVLDTQVKFSDRTKARDMLNRIYAIYKDRVAVGGDPDAPPVAHNVTVKIVDGKDD